MKKIIIASDHAGYSLKEYIKNLLLKKKMKIKDLGTKTLQKVDYPVYAHKLCNNIEKDRNSVGILICGSGQGMIMAANKHKKVRAALCYNVKSTKLSRLHNDANVITLGGRLTSKKLAFKCLNAFLSTKFEGGRHKKRVKKI